MSRKGREAAPAMSAAKLKTWGRFAALSRHKAAPMYGLAHIVYLLLNIGTRLHLCIRPIRGSFSLLANIVVSSQCAVYIEAITSGL